jgi:hypothetical protein
MNRQDDPTLVGHVVLLRRIPPTGGRVEWIDGKPFPSSRNFQDQNNELSVYIASETTPETALSGHDGFGLVSFTAQQIRDAFAEFNRPVIICRDEDDPANGHVLVCGEATRGICRRIKFHANWVSGFIPDRVNE